MRSDYLCYIIFHHTKDQVHNPSTSKSKKGLVSAKIVSEGNKSIVVLLIITVIGRQLSCLERKKCTINITTVFNIDASRQTDSKQTACERVYRYSLL